MSREEWTRGAETPPAVKVLVWFTDGSKMKEKDHGWSLWAICGKKAQHFSRKVQFFRLRYMLSWTVGQRHTLVFVLTVRLPKRLHWYDSAKGR